MRRLAIALMIALLPLRGWVGDAMAMEMAAATLEQPAQAIESGAVHTHDSRFAADLDTQAAMHADCPGHADSHAETAQTSSNCGSCAACQICHAVALAPSFPHLAPAPLSAERPRTAGPDFASADRAQGIKPPIS